MRPRHAVLRRLVLVALMGLLLLGGAVTPVAGQESPSGPADLPPPDDTPPTAPPVDPPVLDAPLGETAEVRGARGVRSYEPNPDAVLRSRRVVQDTDRWAIVTGRDRIALLHGARRVQVLPRTRRGVVTLPEITETVDDPRWIEEVEDGVFLVKAALAHGEGTRLEIAGPRVRELRLADRPDVFLLGSEGAQAEIRDTRVVGWDERRGDVDVEHERSRPFILYTFGARLDVRDSEIAYLGYNRGSAYGLSWREGDATGSVVNSEVHHLFFGMYSYEAVDIELRDSQWHHCVYYGIDPHDFTTGMVVVGNESYSNGSHGIIFSTGVSGGVVRNNVSRDNGGNGIVMDFRSDNVSITGNEVRDNAGDGIVILGSSGAQVSDNTVAGNRVGLRVNLPSERNVFARNDVSDSRVGAQVYDGARATVLRDNIFRDSADTGVVADGAQTRVTGGEIIGAGVGLDVRGVATADGVAIRRVNRGVEIRDVGILRARNLQIRAAESGVQATPGSLVRVFDSQVTAPEPFVGTLRAEEGNSLWVPWSALWLVLAGIAFIALAVLLQIVHRLRNRGRLQRGRAVVAPPGVTNVR